METKKCSKCGIIKEVCEYHKHPTSKLGVRGICKTCRLSEKEKYDNDLNFKLKHILRCRINKIIKYNRNESSIEILGCTINDFKTHIENNFKDGMTWDNYSYYGWHIDHIIPLSSANSDEELMKLCHYSNLQPLWSY